MTLRDIANIRLNTQQIAGTEFKTPKDIVSWMGVMQAQDYSMAKWAIGTRLPNSTEQLIETALDKGEIIRTHILRPTWHFVSAADIYWMLELSTAKIKTLMKTNNKALELTEIVFRKTNKLLEKALIGGKHLTRADLILMFQKNKIPTNENRLSHILLWAELDGIICSGAKKIISKPMPCLQKESLKKQPCSRKNHYRNLLKNISPVIAPPHYRILFGGRAYQSMMQKMHWK